jgi:para-aminobenzoate synthetase component I
VAQLYELQSFSNVHHLVSTISGCLAPNKTSIDLLRDCFPGGSITGVPKIRAMQIIEGIEPCRRNLYCGSIGYIDTCGNMDCNIAIRSIIRQQQHLFCYAGGAIVADSSPELEYTETLAKISWLFRGLNGKISSAYG